MKPNNRPKINPCRKCGCKGKRMSINYDGEKLHYVKCKNCGGVTHWFPRQSDAIRHWNKGEIYGENDK